MNNRREILLILAIVIIVYLIYKLSKRPIEIIYKKVVLTESIQINTTATIMTPLARSFINISDTVIATKPIATASSTISMVDSVSVRRAIGVSMVDSVSVTTSALAYRPDIATASSTISIVDIVTVRLSLSLMLPENISVITTAQAS